MSSATLDALLLAAGELRRQVVRLVREAHGRQRAQDLGVGLLRRRAGDLEREGHVLARRPVLQEPEILEHDPQPAAERGDLAGPDLPEIRTVPAVGRSSIVTSLTSVVLPAPDGPVTNMNSPLRRWNETSCSA
jgi:hypothetical protein